MNNADSGELDQVWKALSDKTRRSILDILRDGPKQTTEIVNQFPQLTRFGVMKHLDILRQAKLVNARTEGRKKINYLNVIPIRQICERWINKYEAYWANTMLRIQERAEEEVAAVDQEQDERA